jgi:hypothetical protein
VLAGARSAHHLGGKAVGATFHDRSCAAPAYNDGSIDICVIRYSPGHPGVRMDVFPRMSADSPTLTYNFKSMAPMYRSRQGTGPSTYRGDLWIPSPVNYYRFALSARQIDGILCALYWPEQIRELTAGLTGGRLRRGTGLYGRPRRSSNRSY